MKTKVQSLGAAPRSAVPAVRYLQQHIEIFQGHNRAVRKSKLKTQGAPVRYKTGGFRMRQERAAIDVDGKSVGYTFFFQIADEGGRRACCVKVDASNVHEASALFRQKWPAIELMARDGKGGGTVDGVITLVVP
jgi:hypothetical protein